MIEQRNWSQTCFSAFKFKFKGRRMTMCGSFFFLTLVQLPLMYSKLGVWGPPVLSKNGGEIKSQDECNKHWKKKEGTKLVFSAKLIL